MLIALCLAEKTVLNSQKGLRGFGGIGGKRQLIPFQQQFHYISIRRAFGRSTILLQQGGGPNAAVVNVDVVPVLFVLYTGDCTFHGHVGMTGKKDHISVYVQDSLQLFIPVQIRPVGPLGVVG